MKLWITSGIIVVLSTLVYFYYTRTEDMISTINTQKELIKTQKEEIKQLNSQIVFEKITLEGQSKKLEEYINKTQEIKIVVEPVIVYKEVVKTLPQEVIVETANEDTNEIITSISNSAAVFSGVHNN